MNRSIQLERPIYKSDDIFVKAIDLFDSNWNNDPIRLLGIALSDFKEINETEQISIFDDQNNDISLNALLHELNHNLGSNQLVLASELNKVKK